MQYKIARTIATSLDFFSWNYAIGRVGEIKAAESEAHIVVAFTQLWSSTEFWKWKKGSTWDDMGR